METTTCNLCGSPSASYRYTLADYYLQRFDVEATLVQCSQCGLVYQNPRPTLAEMSEHYPPEYPLYQTGKGRQPGRLLQWAYDYGMRKRGRFVTRHKQTGALLDVGCATGVFLDGMRRQGTWELHGVELTPEVAKIARRERSLDVFAGTLEEASYPDQSFDVVTLWDVLEHLHDPTATLREIHRILKDDGLLVIRVPNLASWDAQWFGRYWAGLDAPRHLYVFTPQTLAQMLQRAGFDVIDESSAIAGYLVLVLSIHYWMNAAGVGETTKRRLLRLLHHPVMRLLSAPIFFWPSRILRGPVLVTTASKNAIERVNK
ncbi:MAG: class I SAM-dependent methyltransferase [Caldilineaceae bacterium]|nr:class I SAM-dependent methyltransferase [Caldilineaceae bacterium]